MVAMIIGTFGVSLLLVGFGLNITKKLSENSTTYLVINIVGSLMAGWYAFVGEVYPFVVLEIVWAVVALVRIIKNNKTKIQT